MTSLEAYLDCVCRQLRVNPAEVEDIRQELRSHLEESIKLQASQGLDRPRAVAAALSQFGDAGRVYECLDRVHQGDPWWLLRLKGLGLGLVLGAFLGVLAPIGGHLELLLSAFSLPDYLDPSRTHIAINAMFAGGVVGLLSAGGRGLLIGWCVGSLLWLAEYVMHWVAGLAGGTVGSGENMLNSVLLAPLLGGIFGVLVGAAVTAILSAASRIRPQIQ